MATHSRSVLKSFKHLSRDVKELYLRQDVPVIESPISPLQFYRDWVAPNLPVLIRGAMKKCPAMKKWNIQFFRDRFGEKLVTVAITPNGYADAIATRLDDKELPHEYFVTPEERIIPMSEFLNALENNDKYPGVFYIQRQNSNLTEDFPELVPDVGNDIPWASEAFHCKPEAVNIWIGDQRAVTSMHKDPFENIYCVISGFKDFILHPPTDRPWIPYKKYPPASYKEVSPGIFDIIPNDFNKNDNNVNDENHQSSFVYHSKYTRSDYKVDSDDTTNSGEHFDEHCKHTTNHSDFLRKNVCIRCHVDDDFVDGFTNYLNRLEIDENLEVQVKNVCEMYINDYKAKNVFNKDPCSSAQSVTLSDDEDMSEVSLDSLNENSVPWISVDPLLPDFESYPLYKNATPITVRVEAGDALFLPSLWFHHVQQSHACIAVNYWYDMQFDLKYAYFQFLESLLEK